MNYKTIIFLAMLLSSGCSLFNPADETHDLVLTLGNGFNHDWVVVELAGEVVVADTLLSDEYRTPPICCAPAASATVHLTENNQVLRVRINERLEQTYAFDASQWEEIGIRYDRSQQRVIFLPRREVLVYEG